MYLFSIASIFNFVCHIKYFNSIGVFGTALKTWGGKSSALGSCWITVIRHCLFSIFYDIRNRNILFCGGIKKLFNSCYSKVTFYLIVTQFNIQFAKSSRLLKLFVLMRIAFGTITFLPSCMWRALFLVSPVPFKEGKMKGVFTHHLWISTAIFLIMWQKNKRTFVLWISILAM